MSTPVATRNRQRMRFAYQAIVNRAGERTETSRRAPVRSLALRRLRTARAKNGWIGVYFQVSSLPGRNAVARDLGDAAASLVGDQRQAVVELPGTRQRGIDERLSRLHDNTHAASVIQP